MAGLILLTGLVLTEGHRALIDFGFNFMEREIKLDGGEDINLTEWLNDTGPNDDAGTLNIIVSSRSFEPTKGEDRVNAIVEYCEKTYGSNWFNVELHDDDDAPQSDDGTQAFWDYWKEVVASYSVGKIEYVFASEPYGLTLAKHLGAEYIPYDTDREVVQVKGTDVRQKILRKEKHIFPTFKKYISQSVVLFGAESVGKTTMTKSLAKIYHTTYQPEWARVYLEAVGSELTDEKMRNIVHGQHALDVSTRDKLLVLKDTDLLTTIGYYRINNMEPPEEIYEFLEENKAGLYVLLSTNVPFVEDELRYGGVQRESDDQFWIDILEEFGFNYRVVDSDNFDDRERDCMNFIDEFVKEKFGPIIGFIRD